jgi:hypothetical protein
MLPADEERVARGHIEVCSTCRQEIQALHAIDPLIKSYFKHELARALKRPSGAVAGRERRRSLRLGLAVTALAGILLVFVVRSPQVNTGRVPESIQPQMPPAASVEPTPPNVKADAPLAPERAKPSPGGERREATPERAPRGGPAPVSGLGPDAPDFLVTDPAGHSRTLDDYRGYSLLVGVWSGNQPRAAASLERLYKTFGSNTKLRLIGVSNQRDAKPANTTFPIVYNQGSRLLDAKPGEYVLLDESGIVRLRGSLTGDLGELQMLLRKN